MKCEQLFNLQITVHSWTEMTALDYIEKLWLLHVIESSRLTLSSNVQISPKMSDENGIKSTYWAIGISFF